VQLLSGTKAMKLRTSIAHLTGQVNIFGNSALVCLPSACHRPHGLKYPAPYDVVMVV
jgi:hypothetical protein